MKWRGILVLSAARQPFRPLTAPLREKDFQRLWDSEQGIGQVGVNVFRPGAAADLRPPGGLTSPKRSAGDNADALLVRPRANLPIHGQIQIRDALKEDTRAGEFLRPH